MSIFFDFKTINELMGDNYYRQPKEFTLEDLSQYNGSNGVVDIFTNAPKAGFLIDDDYMSDMNNMNFRSTMPTNRQVKQDTSKFTPDEWQNTGASQLLKSGASTSGGMSIGGSTGTGGSGSIGTGGTTGTGGSGGMSIGGSTGTGGSGGIGTGGIGTSDGTMPTKQDTSKFTPDDWIRYIAPLVTYALRETTQGMNTQRAYQKFILLGVLVGLGKTPQEAINQVQEWQNTGASQLLKSGISTGSAGTSGSIGAGGIGTGTGTSESGGIGIGGSTGTSGNTNRRNRLYFD